MAGTLNVNRSVDDVFYRYKMPKLIAKVEGKGNGIKTVIANMTEIAKALNRPPTYPTKYFGCELGAQTQFDMKNERFIVNGEHDAAKLQNLLDGFIKKFVLCPECENPETTLTVRKNQIFQACKACGNKGMIDPRQKLTTFIIKCPPTDDANGTGADAPATAAVKSTSSAKKHAKKGREPGHHSPTTTDDVRNGTNGAPADGVADEDEATPPLENGSQNASEGDDDDDGDWVVDPNAETERQITNAMSALLMNADLEKSVEERLEMFERFAQKQKKLAAGKQLDAKALVNEAKRLDVKDKAALVLSGVVFDENIMVEIAPASSVLLHFTKDSKRAQKYFIGGIEQVVVAHKAALLPKVAHILKAFYDADVLDEATILEWAAKPSKKYVTKDENKEIIMKAEPFLKWLREAESESDENEEDDVEIVYAPAGKATANATRAATKTGEDEFNIDDI